ncbi:hypothetical protein FF2_045976 [Malus domestica]
MAVDNRNLMSDEGSEVVGGVRVDPDELKRFDDGRVGGNAVEADIGLRVGDECEEIRVGAGAGEVLGPRGAPGKDNSALDGDVEGGGVRLAVVVVVNSEGADVVASGGQIGDYVVVLFCQKIEGSSGGSSLVGGGIGEARRRRRLRRR